MYGISECDWFKSADISLPVHCAQRGVALCMAKASSAHDFGRQCDRGILFLQKLELTWSVVFLGINLLTALGGIGIASLLRKLIRDLHEEGGTGHTR